MSGITQSTAILCLEIVGGRCFIHDIVPGQAGIVVTHLAGIQDINGTDAVINKEIRDHNRCTDRRFVALIDGHHDEVLQGLHILDGICVGTYRYFTQQDSPFGR